MDPPSKAKGFISPVRGLCPGSPELDPALRSGVPVAQPMRFGQFELEQIGDQIHFWLRPQGVFVQIEPTNPGACAWVGALSLTSGLCRRPRLPPNGKLSHHCITEPKALSRLVGWSSVGAGRGKLLT